MADTGLPGQAERQQPLGGAEPRRLARLERHAPEALLHAEVGEGALDVVVGPTDTPPETHTTSAASSAPSSAARVPSAVSGTVSAARRRRRRPAPARPAPARSSSRSRPAAAACPAGPARRRWPGAPPAARRAQRAVPWPTLASTPSAAGPSAAGREHRRRPARTSSPGARTLAPRRGRAPAPRRRPPRSAPPGSRRRCPSGTTAPVEIRTAVPGSTAPPKRVAGPRLAGDPQLAERPAGTANPSMAELANGGTSTSLVTSSARMRPRASARGTSSAASGRTASRTCRRAVSTGSARPRLHPVRPDAGPAPSASYDSPIAAGSRSA